MPTSSQASKFSATSPTSTTLPHPLRRAKLRVSLSSGDTAAFELPDEIDRWLALRRDPSFQAQIRGMTLMRNGHSYALCAPRAFRRVVYNVEVLTQADDGGNPDAPPTAIRASYVADDVTGTLTLYLNDNPPMVRFDVKQSGRLRWAP